MKKAPPKNKRQRFAGLTLAMYAEAKLLKISFLKKLGLSDMQLGDKPAVGIPYKDVDGVEQAARIRIGLTGARFRWARGSEPCLYGLWRLEKMSGKGYIVLVEGESDAQTLWLHGIPALGLPGANSWKEEWAQHLEGISKIFVFVEPDRGGDAVLKRLTKSGIRQRLKLVRLDGAKDPSELYLKDPKHFKKNFRAALKAAEPWAESEQPEVKDDDDAGDSAVRMSQASQLIAIADSAQLFRSEGRPFATIPVNGHSEHWPVASNHFKQWLGQSYYQSTKQVPRGQSLSDALNVISGRALYEGVEQPVFTRMGALGENIYLDLADSAWRAVEITRHGWKLVDVPPVCFRRTGGMSALPAPAPGGKNLNELWPFVNVSRDERVLVAAWLVTSLRPCGPYPILGLHGEQGTGKTTSARVLRSLIDPSIANMRSTPRSVQDLMITATNSHVLAFDNLSHLEPWLSDALCTLSTGGGFATRALYTDSEEVVFNVMRPILLNGIAEVTSRADLMERTVLLTLPEIPKDERLPEGKFWRRFEVARPRILGVLVDALSAALRDVESIQPDELPRMADFATWSAAAEEALGFAPDTFAEAYQDNSNEANSIVLDASPVAVRVQQFLESPSRETNKAGHPRWEGTASELWDSINAYKGTQLPAPGGWPKTPAGLGVTLKRLAPNLRKVGVEVRQRRTAKQRIIELVWLGSSVGGDE